MSAPRFLAIVRRGAERTFRVLNDEIRDPGVEVIWDRRGAARRVQPARIGRERRRAERRTRPTATWGALGFILVPRRGPCGEHPRIELEQLLHSLRIVSRSLGTAADQMRGALDRIRTEQWNDL